MIINTLTLKNFRSYEDETTFSFTPKNGKNIVLIGGENGAGKSSIFEAIKLCIYGPTTYGYIGLNHNYLAKIKNIINDNAYKNKDVESLIALSISFKDGTQVKDYYLKRSWKYIGQKLHEEFDVSLFGEKLNSEDKLFFDKYLKSVLPPSLFDFFFFDGEELSEFFTGRSSSNNLKDSVLQLFNYDTFNILKKQLLSYQRLHSKSDLKLGEVQNNYEELYSSVKSLKEEINNLKENIEIRNENLESLNIEQEQAEANFRNSGGILEDEKNRLLSQINKLENERLDINQCIKDFCNDTFPFLILPTLLIETKVQLGKEHSLHSYNSIKSKLSDNTLRNVLSDSIKNPLETDYSAIAESLLSEMFNIEYINNVKSILEFSYEDKNSIDHTINNILNNSSEIKYTIQSKFIRLKEISVELKTSRAKLSSTVPSDILNAYLESINLLNNEINKTTEMLVTSKILLEQKSTELNKLEYRLTRAKNDYTTLLQNNNVLEISTNLIDYLDELLNSLTNDKISLIEDEFIKIFKSIIRKENYINSIVIDDKFNSTLYINKPYDTNEVLNILSNLGIEGTTKKYGAKFIEDLHNAYKVKDNKKLIKKISETILTDYLSLSSKVNINDFSKGEKQIYILCLIWAIIKSSGVDIPFIIDTPYARIDETHRNSLTNNYLPNISKQVIILSTNKEIDRGLYKVVKPYVCNEYLLLYNSKERKTEIKNGYFEV